MSTPAVSGHWMPQSGNEGSAQIVRLGDCAGFAGSRTLL
jgi:hypothetical protein